MGLLLIVMVFLAAKYGTMQVVSAEVAERNGRPVVVIDSGHGGNDPGKVGVDGSLEKKINLEIAMRLKQYLELEDIEVIMTRESDTGLYQEEDTSKKMADMRNRCRLINDAKPDLVVSIHQNSYHEEYVSGGQVFYYKDSEGMAASSSSSKATGGGLEEQKLVSARQSSAYSGASLPTKKSIFTLPNCATMGSIRVINSGPNTSTSTSASSRQ